MHAVLVRVAIEGYYAKSNLTVDSEMHRLSEKFENKLSFSDPFISHSERIIIGHVCLRHKCFSGARFILIPSISSLFMNV